MQDQRPCRLATSLEQQAQLLCCALSDDLAWQGTELEQLWQAVGGEAAWSIAVRNRAESIVGQALQRVVEPKALPPHWHEAVGSVNATLKAYMCELDRVADALATEGIRLVALKNAGIARGIVPNLASCPMGDLDVLVNRSDFRHAHVCMTRLGYKLGSRSPLDVGDVQQAEHHGGAEYTYTLGDGSTLWFELQWRPVAGRWIQPDQEPNSEDLIARSVAIPGSKARLLSPEDNLMQVCLHTAKHTYVRAPGFRLHTDVDRIVRRCAVNWEIFVARVEKAQVRTATYFSLEIPRQLLRTPIPDWVLNRLRPSAWKTRLMLAWLQRVGLFNPDQRKWSKPGYIFFNLLLYDNWRGIARAVFPTAKWMRQRYNLGSAWLLPACYVRRLAELLLKRANT